MADTAYATFKFAFKRAVYLFRLYHGLANHRKRGMRADWAENFCRLMHWPAGDGDLIDRVDSPDAIIVLKDGSRLTREVFAADALADLLRASLVMGVSALDAYFHSKIAASVVSCARKGTAMPRALKKATITIEDFVDGNKYQRRLTTVRRSIERSLGYQSLQLPDKIATGLGLIGITDFWGEVANRMGMMQDDLKVRLSSIVTRRNQIAHEGDLSQSKKARNKSRTIEPKYVREALAFIRKLAKRAEDEIDDQL